MISHQSGAEPGAGGDTRKFGLCDLYSGSTGRPKGVQVPARAMVNLLTAMRHDQG